MSDGAFAILSVAIAIVWGVFFYPPPAPATAPPPAKTAKVQAGAVNAPAAHHPATAATVVATR
jgi:hypothetical protein